MDQYPFEFNLTVIGMDLDDFILMLEKNGFDTQAYSVKAQLELQLSEI